MTAKVKPFSMYEAFCSACRWSDEFITRNLAREAARTHNANFHPAGTDAP